MLRKAGLRPGMHERALYIVQVDPPDGPVKIGRARDVYRRWVNIISSWPYLQPIQVLALVRNGETCEGDVLCRFRWCLIIGEWYRPVPELLAFAERCRDLESLLIELHGPRLPLK